MRNRVFVASLLFLAACSSTPAAKPGPASAHYFDSALFDKLTVGKTTKAEVVSIMGQPYSDDPEKATGRWVYMHSMQRQAVLTFDGEVLRSKEWTDKYGINK